MNWADVDGDSGFFFVANYSASEGLSLLLCTLFLAGMVNTLLTGAAPRVLLTLPHILLFFTLAIPDSSHSLREARLGIASTSSSPFQLILTVSKNKSTGIAPVEQVLKNGVRLVRERDGEKVAFAEQPVLSISVATSQINRPSFLGRSSGSVEDCAFVAQVKRTRRC